MRVLLVTSDRTECGIRAYGQMLMEYMPTGEGVEIVEWPHPNWPQLGERLPAELGTFDICHVNHHAALGSAWNAAVVSGLQRLGWKVVVTQHDTFETFAIMQERGFPDFRGADALVVHEPVEGLHDGLTFHGALINPISTHGYRAEVYYLRQGVPTQELPWRGAICGAKPIAGTVGFPLSFKNIETLCRATAAAGWGLLLLVPDATIDQCMSWVALNPNIEFVPIYLGRKEVVARLAECDASIFHSVSGNSGTTGPIRLAIAAGRPIISTGPAVNRQIRDLADADAIIWANSEKDLTKWLKYLVAEPRAVDLLTDAIQELAAQDSWDNLAKAYAGIYAGVMR